ncbi:hypothetical protein Trydic_g17024 [Trypoxylus dichotomus]
MPCTNLELNQPKLDISRHY